MKKQTQNYEFKAKKVAQYKATLSDYRFALGIVAVVIINLILSNLIK